MNRLLLIAIALLISGCGPSAEQRSNYHRKSIGDFNIITIDSCEYIECSYWVGTQLGVYSITHKGNCSNLIHIQP